jgi:hypothetical protein
MKVLFVEGKDPEALRGFARRFPHPYRLLYRPEQGLYLLEVTFRDEGREAQAISEEMEREAAGLTGFRSWSFELIEEDSQHPIP